MKHYAFLLPALSEQAQAALAETTSNAVRRVIFLATTVTIPSLFSVLICLGVVWFYWNHAPHSFLVPWAIARLAAILAIPIAAQWHRPNSLTDADARHLTNVIRALA